MHFKKLATVGLLTPCWLNTLQKVQDLVQCHRKEEKGRREKDARAERLRAGKS